MIDVTSYIRTKFNKFKTSFNNFCSENFLLGFLLVALFGYIAPVLVLIQFSYIAAIVYLVAFSILSLAISDNSTKNIKDFFRGIYNSYWVAKLINALEKCKNFFSKLLLSATRRFNAFISALNKHYTDNELDYATVVAIILNILMCCEFISFYILMFTIPFPALFNLSCILVSYIAAISLIVAMIDEEKEANINKKINSMPPLLQDMLLFFGYLVVLSIFPLSFYFPVAMIFTGISLFAISALAISFDSIKRAFFSAKRYINKYPNLWRNIAALLIGVELMLFIALPPLFLSAYGKFFFIVMSYFIFVPVLLSFGFAMSELLSKKQQDKIAGFFASRPALKSGLKVVLSVLSLAILPAICILAAMFPSVTFLVGGLATIFAILATLIVIVIQEIKDPVRNFSLQARDYIRSYNFNEALNSFFIWPRKLALALENFSLVCRESFNKMIFNAKKKFESNREYYENLWSLIFGVLFAIEVLLLIIVPPIVLPVHVYESFGMVFSICLLSTACLAGSFGAIFEFDLLLTEAQKNYIIEKIDSLDLGIMQPVLYLFMLSILPAITMLSVAFPLTTTVVSLCLMCLALVIMASSLIGALLLAIKEPMKKFFLQCRDYIRSYNFNEAYKRSLLNSFFVWARKVTLALENFLLGCKESFKKMMSNAQEKFDENPNYYMRLWYCIFGALFEIEQLLLIVVPFIVLPLYMSYLPFYVCLFPSCAFLLSYLSVGLFRLSFIFIFYSLLSESQKNYIIEKINSLDLEIMAPLLYFMILSILPAISISSVIFPITTFVVILGSICLALVIILSSLIGPLLLSIKDSVKGFFLKTGSYSIDCASRARDYVGSLLFNTKPSCSEVEIVKLGVKPALILDGDVGSPAENNLESK